MAVTSGFFNSLNGDRKYNANHMNDFLNGVVTPGVFPSVGGKLFVTAGTGTTVNIASGKAYMDGLWFYNDANYPMVLPAAHATNPRIDEIVVIFDKNEAVRANTFGYVTGVATSSPVRPALQRTALKNVYSIASVYRPAGSSTILPQNITINIGTADFPYVASLNADYALSSWINKRNRYGGKNLGSNVTSNQKAAIVNSSFDGLELGDYWTALGNKFRIADFNYFLNHEGFVNPHVVVVPDEIMGTGPMNSTDTTSGGYVNSRMRSTSLAPLYTQVQLALGPSNFLSWPERFSSAVSGGIVSANQSIVVGFELMSEIMLYGNRFAGSFSSTDFESRLTSGFTQLALFRINPSAFVTPTKTFYWLRDVAGSNTFAMFGATEGFPLQAAASAPNVGIRPYFLLG